MIPEANAPKSWLAALGEAATEQGFAWPGFDVFAMGTARSDKTSSGRYLTLKDLYSPDPDRRGVRWGFWRENGDVPVLVAAFVSTADPTPEGVANSLPLFRGWLAENWTPEQTKANIGRHPGAVSVSVRPATAKDKKEYWLSEDHDFGFVVYKDRWQIYSGHRCLSKWKQKDDTSNNTFFGLDSLDRFCTWLVKNWQAIAYGIDYRPPSMLEYGVSASKAYERAVALGGDTDPVLREWWERHSIRAADGELPNLFFERQADDFVVSWDACPSKTLFFEIESGVAAMPAVVGIPRLRSLIEDRSELPVSSLMRDASAGYAAAHHYRDFATKSWLERHDFFEEDARELARSGTSHHPIIGLLRSGRGSSLVSEDYDAVYGHLKERTRGDYERLRNLAKGLSVSIDARHPWESGYWLARNARERLGLERDRKLDIEGLMRDLGVEVHDLELTDPDIRGVCVGTPEYAPLVVVNLTCEMSKGTSGRRVTLAHELCHLLFDRGGFRNLARFEGGAADGDRLIERRANAFALEFLVPMSNLVEDGKFLTSDRLGDIALDWEVSRVALENHLENARNQ